MTTPTPGTSATGPTSGTSTGTAGTPSPGSNASKDSNGSPDTAGGYVSRLRPFDGLFLRAEHLATMEDYTESLAVALGVSGGPGVVYGFDVTLDDEDTLKVGSGLAIGPDGRPLRTRDSMTVPLPESPGRNSYYRVEIRPEKWPYGTETVTGALCDEPCSGRTTQSPYQSEGVRAALIEQTMPGFGRVGGAARRRNWLASRLFAQEEKNVGRWTGEQGVTSGAWTPASIPSTEIGLPLAAAIWSGSAWAVDVWAVRRDRGDPPPTRYWRWKLGMRPWDVFVAQILQFQASLEDAKGAALADQQAELVQRVVKAASQESKGQEPLSPQAMAELIAAISHRLEAGAGPELLTATAEPQPLLKLGLEELPPAGFLPLPPGDLGELGNTVKKYLGGTVDVRVCWGRPADIAQGIEEAQHRPRIVLKTNSEGPAAKIDVLAPRDGTVTSGYLPWVAFVHRNEHECLAEPEEPPPTTTDTVEVFTYRLPFGDGNPAQHVQAVFGPDGEPNASLTSLGYLAYPVNAWALPEQQSVNDTIFATVQDADDLWAVLAVVTADDRRPLGAVRAQLLAARLTNPPNSLAALVDLMTVVNQKMSPEAVVIVLKASQPVLRDEPDSELA